MRSAPHKIQSPYVGDLCRLSNKSRSPATYHGMFPFMAIGLISLNPIFQASYYGTSMGLSWTFGMK